MKTKRKGFPEKGLNGPLAPQRSLKLLIGEADPSYVKISLFANQIVGSSKAV